MPTTTTLTTYAAVATRLGLSGTTSQTVIEQIITDVTQWFARVTGRPKWFREAARVDYLHGDGGRVIMTSLWPIEAIGSIVVASDRVWADGDTLTADDDYRYDADTGLLRYEWTSWPRAFQGIKVTYDAGYTHPDDTPTAPKIALPYDIIEAAIQQTIAIYKRRGDYGTTGERTGDGSVTMYESALLPMAERILAAYMRYTI